MISVFDSDTVHLGAAVLKRHCHISSIAVIGSADIVVGFREDKMYVDLGGYTLMRTVVTTKTTFSYWQLSHLRSYCSALLIYILIFTNRCITNTVL